MEELLSEAEQKGILAICAANKMEHKKEIYKEIKLGRLGISFRWRSSKHFWGRFGGGWQWAIGFEASKHSINLKCLTFSIMVSRRQDA